MEEDQFVIKAVEEAKKALGRDDVPVGAVIVDINNQEIIATASNKSESGSDPTLHAEMLAITKACKQKGTAILNDCDIYVTLEPCPMCAQAISFARFRRLYFGAYDSKSGGVEHGPRIFDSSSCHHKPEVYGGIMESQCGVLLKDFFKGKRR